MSLYGDPECVRLNGDIMCFVRIQNEWTGEVRNRLCPIHLDGNTYWIKADSQRVKVNRFRDDFIRKEDHIKEALEWYRKTRY